MRLFDGDIEEPDDIDNDIREAKQTIPSPIPTEKTFTKAFDSESVCELSDYLGDCFILI